MCKMQSLYAVNAVAVAVNQKRGVHDANACGGRERKKERKKNLRRWRRTGESHNGSIYNSLDVSEIKTARSNKG